LSKIAEYCDQNIDPRNVLYEKFTQKFAENCPKIAENCDHNIDPWSLCLSHYPKPSIFRLKRKPKQFFAAEINDYIENRRTKNNEKLLFPNFFAERSSTLECTYHPLPQIGNDLQVAVAQQHTSLSFSCCATYV
jgi:hypothetical protein